MEILTSSALIISILATIGLIGIGIILTKLYKKSTKERSFIRTGLGGEKVIMNGGAIVFPILHETIDINMNTSKLEISRKNEQALITKDRLRVDVLAEFYVRVKLDAESISKAAQTLGTKTLNPIELKVLVEGKFVDALRSVAAEMNMSELHEKRVDFVQKVQTTVSEDLLKNGLELESVSLTGLDQTEKKYFNQDNIFDAEGLKNLVEQTERRRKEKNEIEKENNVLIEEKNLETEKRLFQINKDKEEAKLNQELEIAKLEATQKADMEKQAAEKRQEAEQATIQANEEIEKRQIQKDKVLQEERIQAEKTLDEKRIEKEKFIEQKDIERKKAIEISNQDKQIAIHNKTKEETEAKDLANIAKAKEVASNEKILTASETEKAERAKKLTIIKAEEEAEKDAIKIKVEATAKKIAATDLADALKIETEAKASAIKIETEAKADAIKIESSANKEKYLVESEGQRQLNESKNVLSIDQMKLEFQKELIKALPDIIEKMVKPLENIDSIKIVDMKNGINASQTIDGKEVIEKSLPDQVVDASLKHRTSLPLINDLMKEAGFGDLNSVANLVGTLQENK